MPRFKVGDKVKIISYDGPEGSSLTYYARGLPLGSVHTIEGMQSNDNFPYIIGYYGVPEAMVSPIIRRKNHV